MATRIRKESRKRRKNGVRGITEVRVRGFKSIIGDSAIEIRRLTILAGQNSSGKSSIIQPLLLIKQTLETPFDSGPLNIAGPNVQFTSAEQLLSRSMPRQRANEFEIQIETARERWVRLRYQYDGRSSFNIAEMKFLDDGKIYSISESMTSGAIRKSLESSDEFQNATRVFTKDQDQEDLKFSVRRERCFLNIDVPFRDSSVGVTMSPAGPMPYQIQEVLHIPGLRGNPERNYRTTSVTTDFPGLFTDYFASIIHAWKETRDDRISALGRDLARLGLTWKVDTRQVDDTRVEVRVGRMPQGVRGGASDLVSLADVGFGVSQTLPVLVALLVAEPDQLVFIEQPELHLHPRAQVELASTLIAAANRGVRLVVETHSSLLLLALQTLVAEGKIEPKRTILHWFTRSMDVGETMVSSRSFDEFGGFGDWPSDFGEIELALQDRYLTLVEKSAHVLRAK